MTIQQMFVALCLFLATQQITAVVNNSKFASLEEPAAKNSTTLPSSSPPVSDSAPAASEQDLKRLEVSISGLGGGFDTSLTGNGLDTYIPTGPSNPSLPIPVYGVPDGPSNNIIYPSPPPDIPPPLPSTGFGSYGPPKPFNNFGRPPPLKYGPPVKPFKSFRPPRPQYGPPKPLFVPKPPKISYGPPKSIYGVPKGPLFAPQKNNFKQQSVTIVTLPNLKGGQYPIGPVGHYGPPDPVPHGPPHPGVPAPPTPPDIKYDGWQPIPGLVSRPPSESYGVPEGNLQLNSDFTPPPVGGGYNLPHGLSDSYGAPLNSVTGSGGTVIASGNDLHDDHSLSLGLSAAGINSGQNHLSVIKSIGYELFPSNVGDSYSAPPLNSYSPDGPYAAAHSYKSNGISGGSSFLTSLKSHGSSNFHHSLGLSSSGIGLIPPSGVYGTPPGSHYGTPLLSKPGSLNALKINPPKHPVIFREPVPVGLIESVGAHTAHKDAHGIIENGHNLFNGPAYIPPPVPELPKPVREEQPLPPTTLYSLPHVNSAVSFQNLAHGSSLAGLGSFSAQQQPLNSYSAPLGTIDGSYTLPLQSGPGYSLSLDNAHAGGVTVGIESHPPVTIDLTSSTSNSGPVLQLPRNLGVGYPNVPHDCGLQKTSQPLPSLSYGVPLVNGYTGSLQSLTTNIGGAYQGPSLNYGSPDLYTAPSQVVNSGEVESGKAYGKSLAASFGPNSELVKSESIDLNNIPVQGSLGSYTLQIQSAGALGSSRPVEAVPHAQVLNDGLLQSILAAIEHPRQQDATILGQPLLQLQPNGDGDAQQSVTNPVVVSAPVTEPSAEGGADTATALPLIDNNEIALFFNNNVKNQTEIRNGQQYGNFGESKQGKGTGD